MTDAQHRVLESIKVVNRALKSGAFANDEGLLSIKMNLELALDPEISHVDRLAHMEAADNLCNAYYPASVCDNRLQLHYVNTIRLTIFPC